MDNRSRSGIKSGTKVEYGVGLECSLEIASRPDSDELLKQISCIELIPESYFFGRKQEFLTRVGNANTPVIGHCVDLSIGTDEPLDRNHLANVKQVLDQVNCVIFSDHLCMTEAADIEIGQLTTLPFTQKTVDVVCRKVDALQKMLTVPFMIENITNRFLVPGNEFSEPEFINKVTSGSGCGLLLDVTNLHINSLNFKFDPYAWFDQINAKSVMGIHLAGGIKEKQTHYDTHSRPVPKEVWALLSYVLKTASPKTIIIEWDQDVPEISRLMEEVRYGERIVAGESVKVKASRNKQQVEMHA